MTDHHQTEVLIVGAGMAGLTAARRLSAAGRAVLVVDKGRSVGGRLATRRLGGGQADHGAQFFTTRAASFVEAVHDWRERGLVYEWSRGWSDGSLATSRPDGFPRYAVTGGFNQLPKALAEGVDIRLTTRLVAVRRSGGQWLASDERGAEVAAAALILTAPVPQSLALLAAGETSLAPEDSAALARVAYAPCLCGLFVVQGDTTLPEPGALQRPDDAISWIADNQRKGISPGARVITVHAGPAASAVRWTWGDEAVSRWLEDGLRPNLARGAAVVEGQLKRWRYALPTTLHPEPVIVADRRPPLVFAGDAFGTPRVEGAFLSGLAAADALLSDRP